MTEWINIKEREPPDNGQDFLVYNGKYMAVGCLLYKDDDGSYVFNGVGPIWDVTHWAELPEPPEDS